METETSYNFTKIRKKSIFHKRVADELMTLVVTSNTQHFKDEKKLSFQSLQ